MQQVLDVLITSLAQVNDIKTNIVGVLSALVALALLMLLFSRFGK